MTQSTSPKSMQRLLIGCALAVVAIGMLIEAIGLGWLSGADVVFPNADANKIAGGLVMLAGLIVLLLSPRLSHARDGQAALLTRLRVDLETWDKQDDAISARRRMLNLVLVSFLGLFFELTLIRWLGAEIKIFAYLKNIVLIAVFLGLGIGFFYARRRVGLLPLFLPSALLVIVTVLLGDALGFWTRIVLPNSEQLVLLGVTFSNMQTAPLLVRLISWLPFYIFTILYFLLIVWVFIPLGQYTGKSMQSFAPISGYSLNLLGSFAGSVLFTAVSFAWLPPVVWFGLAAVILVAQMHRQVRWLWRLNVGVAFVWIIAFGLIPGQLAGATWSPYNPIIVHPLYDTTLGGERFQTGYQLGVGQYYYQDVLDLSADFFAAHPNFPKAYRNSEYEVPYKFIRPNSVLILGAGTGNDVAAALRNGARDVVAVEIDPAILDAGRQWHPERPYAVPGVTLVADDARSYIRKSDRTFDLVAFGLLDSYQVLSAFGSVRLDNFVYTVEGMRDAYARVKPNGLLAVTFEIYEPWIAERINGILTLVTGQAPLIINAHHGTSFLIRKGTPLSLAERDAAIAALENQAQPIQLTGTNVPLTTDDWPYLYMRDREIPFAYLTMLPILGALSIWLIRRAGMASQWGEWHFFFLGAGFLLMEVRVISQVALLFGSTWVVNAIAITAILLMAILSNGVVAWRKFEDTRPWGVSLIVTLVASSLIPSSVFLTMGLGIGGTIAALVLALPIFFASTVFSISFRQTTSVERALAANLTGAILGGFTEYFSLLGGIGNLAWLAGIYYVLALTFKWFRH